MVLSKTLIKDELWPWYLLDDARELVYHPTIAIDQEFYEEYERVTKAFFDLQDKLESMYDDKD